MQHLQRVGGGDRLRAGVLLMPCAPLFRRDVHYLSFSWHCPRHSTTCRDMPQHVAECRGTTFTARNTASFTATLTLALTPTRGACRGMSQHVADNATKRSNNVHPLFFSLGFVGDTCPRARTNRSSRGYVPETDYICGVPRGGSAHPPLADPWSRLIGGNGRGKSQRYQDPHSCAPPLQEAYYRSLDGRCVAECNRERRGGHRRRLVWHYPRQPQVKCGNFTRGL